VVIRRDAEEPEAPDEFLRDPIESYLRPLLQDLAQQTPIPSALIRALSPRYTIAHQLGHGGMASVYLAFDQSLQRPVAVKVLEPAIADVVTSERFLREIELTAQLRHSRIVPVHDRGEGSGLLFYIMQHFPAGSLRERLDRSGSLSIPDTVAIATDVAQALDYAHQHGIVHRDIKPENILFDDEGAVVADFGVARLIAMADRKKLTQTGIAIGTPFYMSPEQADTSAAIDGRSDVYALGCVVYEMLAGEPPFTGPDRRTILAKHAATPPPDVTVVRDTVTPGMQQTIATALSKTPADRYATAGAFVDALQHAAASPTLATSSGSSTAQGPPRTVVVDRRRRRAMVAAVALLTVSLAFVATASRNRAAATPRIQCVAVLPATNLSGDSTLEHFAEAMTAATINELERYEQLEVRSRSSVLPFKGSTKPLPEIGRALRCDGVVEASVTRSNSVAHVDAQILYAPGDRHLWAESYEDDTSRLLVLERRVINAVTRRVRALAGQTAAQLPKRRAEPVVYSAYLRGRDEFRGWNAPSVRLAVEYFKQAIVLDSTFAPAYAGLADAYNLIGAQGYGPLPYLTYRDSARTLAERALALDSASSEAHTTKGYNLTGDGDWTQAEVEFRKAIELDPNNALAHLWYAVLLAILDRNEEALSEIRRAADLDPLSQEIEGKRVNFQFAAGVKTPLGNPGRVQGWADPNHPISWATRAITLARKGQCAEAYQANQRAQELAPDNTIMLLGLVFLDRACNDSIRANALFARLKQRSDTSVMAIYIAMVHVTAHEPDSAFAWLNRSRWTPQSYLLLRQNRELDPLRSDPRFPKLLRRLNLL
jgi:serine/threonine protein kinase/tetratricopeptide (TPR) repeat protein